MLYMIGGASRSGKTLATRKICQAKKIPFLSVDFLVMGFTNGMPHVGIDANQPGEQIAMNIWPFLRGICVCMIENREDFVIEGESMMPHQIYEIMQDYPDDVRSCFIGYSKISETEKLKEIRENNSGRNDWTSTETDESVLRHIKRMTIFSKTIESECNRLGIKYFDSSKDFISVNRRVAEFLTAKA